MQNVKSEKPKANEYAAYYGIYISLIEEKSIVKALSEQIEKTLETVSNIPEDKGTFCYAENKWSIKELIGHIIDTERIMAYRALRFARHDSTEIEGFDQDPYIENADFNSCSLEKLAAELNFVRQSNIRMFDNFTDEAWLRSGIASGNPVSVRALAYIIAGHEIHHINVLKERYLD